MPKAKQVSLVVVGSVALDSIETPVAKKTDVMGGSCSFACAAASFFAPVGMVGVVGTDFPERHVSAYRKLGIDINGLQRVKGKTFRWSGVYEQDMNSRRTLSTDLNVFADFKPRLPDYYKSSPYLFLANISPDLQYHVLKEVRKARFVVADTMDLWIRVAKRDLLKVLSGVDMIMINDSEAHLLTGERFCVTAARKVLEMGPRFVVVKKGEHGALLVSKKELFMVPAFPVEKVVDPTGAGDTFAGGFMGALIRSGGLDSHTVREAMLYGTVMASFAVQSFGIGGLSSLKQSDINRRMALLRSMTRV